MAFEVQKIAQANTGAMTLSITSTGGTTSASLYWADGNALQAGDWPASSVALCMFDGTYYRVLSVTKRPVTFPEGAYVHYGVASGTNTLTTTTTPNFTSMADGIFLELVPTQANTGPCTLSANGLNPAAIQNLSGGNLASGQLQPSQPVLLMALGGVWKLFGGGGGGGASPRGLRVIVSSTTYVPTAGTTKGLVFVTGGGAAGATEPAGQGGGGGAGGTAIALVDLTGVNSVNCIVGGGGAAVPPSPPSPTTGGDGGASSFGSYAAANGGTGAFGANAGVGGNATLGGMLIEGGDGECGMIASLSAAGGGASFWGGGGKGGTFLNFQGPTQAPGNPGRAYGSGGGGSGTTLGPISGNGKAGVIVVLEF
jgi:hypothetical protein